MQPKFTPGPWYSNAGGKRASVYSDGGHVAFCSRRHGGTSAGLRPVSKEEMEANAHLISAAPELLQSVIDWFFVMEDKVRESEKGAPSTHMWRDRLESARQAVAKAYGVTL